MLCLGFLRTVDQVCIEMGQRRSVPAGLVPPLPVLAHLEGRVEVEAADSPDSVFGYWLLPERVCDDLCPGLLAAHPAGQARGAQAGVVGRMVSGLLSVQALALRGRPWL